MAAEAAVVPRVTAAGRRAGAIGDAAFRSLTFLFALLVLLILGGVIVALIDGDLCGFVRDLPKASVSTPVGVSAPTPLPEFKSAFRLATRAFDTARDLSLTTIALTGEGGGQLASRADILFDVPSRSTPLIQQAHICIYHYLCQRIEAEFV